MTQKKTASRQHSRQRQCCHHWMIEPAEGPTSVGVCKLCNKKSEFKNNLQIAPQGDGENGRNGQRPVQQVSHHVQDGPLCRKCGKAMDLETWFGVAVSPRVRLFWCCHTCKVRNPVFFECNHGSSGRPDWGFVGRESPADLKLSALGGLP